MQEKDATTKSFMNKLTAIYEVLCKLLNATNPSTTFTVTGENCAGTPVTADATSTVQTVPHPDFVQKVQLCSAGIDPEVVCLSNDGGATIVKGIVEFDTSTVPATKTIYLFDGSIATGYTVVPCSTKTFDTEFRQVCVDGQNWTQIFVFDKSVSMVAPVQIGWLDQNDAVVVAPSPTLINNINCKGCKKEIFATHDRFISVPSVPVGFVAYEMTNDLPTQGLDVSNAYFHLIYPTLNGTQNIAYGPQLTDYFANPQNGILFNDIAGVQAVIDFVLPSMNLSVGDVVYTINTTNTPIFFLSATAVAELANGTFLHIYWGAVDTHNNYNEKADVNVVAANPNILLGGENKCVGIQEIKEKDTCTGEETYRYVIEDLNGNLVKVDSIYPDFVEADVLLQCPIPSTPTIEDWELLEVELVDDVANDGTGLIIPYSELYAIERDGTRVLIATVDNKGANYTLLGTRRAANEIGVPATTKTNQFVLNGIGFWSPSEVMASFSYTVISVGNINNPPTFRGTNNVSVPMFIGESVSYDVIDGTEKFDITNVRITSNTGDVIKIIYTQI